MTDIRIVTAASRADDGPWHEVMTFAPHLLWAAVLLFLFLWVGRRDIAAFLARVRKVSIAGVEVELGDEIKAAAQQRNQTVTGPQAMRLSRRLARCGLVLARAKILWVDDYAESHERETEILESLDATIILAASNQEARTELRRLRFDLVISDIRRGDDDQAGLATLPLARTAPSRPLVIFYVGQVAGPTPEGAFGITDRPEELLHLVLDALARRRG